MDTDQRAGLNRLAQWAKVWVGIELLARGLSNSEIAGQLHLSEGTVRNHVSAILSKLDVADRTQAAINAIHHGLDQ